MPLRVLWTKMHRHRIRGCLTFSTVQLKVAQVGIDFGCKTSRAAVVESLVPQVIASEIGHFSPSYVTLTVLNSPTPWCMQHLDRVGKPAATGGIAKLKMLNQPSDVVFGMKRLIGKQFGDPQIQELRKRVHFSIVEGPSGEAWVELHGMKFSPVEISAAVLAKLKDTVLMYQFYHKLQVVISVPSFFSRQQREDIKLAGNIAGLDVLQVIDEPTAALLSRRVEGTVVVFGMSSSSYSISILHVPDTSMKDMKVKAQCSDPFVGGDRFDCILLDHFVSRIIELHSVDIREDKYAMMILAEKAEQAKMDLSSQPKVTISIPYLTASPEGSIHFNVTISRQEFEKLVEDLVAQIKHKCQSMLKDANITDNDVDEIVLYGGMTKMPKIQGIICEVFGKHQISTVDPEEALAIGSAIQATLVAEERREMCEDIIPLSIGIESAGGTFTRVIPRTAKLPAKQTVTIPAWLAYGESLPVRIFLGEHGICQHNLPLGEVQLINNRSSYHGSIHFKVTFEVDKDYVVKVSATDADTDCPFEAAADTWKVLETFTIGKNVMFKHNADKAVRDALLNWTMFVTEAHDPRRSIALYTLNTLDDLLLTRRDELPKAFYDDALIVLTELRGALETEDMLKDKVLNAEAMVTKLLNWTSSESPPEQLLRQ